MNRSLFAFLIVFAFSNVGSRAQDQPIYTDTLLNGWQNWSWATVDLANGSPVHSGSRSAAVSAGAWQAIYLHHDAFNSTGLTDLSLWIHGGASGGQLLQVQALLSGTAQVAVPIGPLTPDAWQKVTIPLSSLGADNKPNLDGFWIQDRSGATQPTFFVDDLVLNAVPPPSSVSITVDAGQTLRTIDARHFAVNAAVWDAVFDSPTTISLLSEMGNPILRFPGGSLSDEYHWQSNTSGNNTWQWATSFDKFAHVLTGTAANAFVTVNYGSGTSTEAADWVRYANVTKGLGIKYWEVGNENYGDWETDNNSRPHDPYTYAVRFKDYSTQMKAVDPSIKIGAVVVTGEDSYANFTDHPATNLRTGQSHNGWTAVMLATMRTLGVTPDFLVYHRYAQGPGGESDSALLQSSATWGNDASDLRGQLNDYLGANASAVELICTENNSVYTTPGKQTTSLVNGLFLADSLGHLLNTEFNGLVWWDLRNGQETGNNNSSALHGWRQYGDYGIVSGADPAGPADRYPTFYVAKLLKYFARSGDRLSAASSDYNLLSAFAVRRADGSIRILVINKSPSTALNANIALSGFTPASPSMTVFSYGIPQDEAARTGVGSADISQTTASGASSGFSYTFAPYSATVLVLDGGSVPPPPPPAPTRQPDTLVKNSSESTYVGNNIYSTDGANQTKAQTVRAGKSVTYHFSVQNDGSAVDSFRLVGSPGSSAFAVKYYTGLSGGSDITAGVTSGSYMLNNLGVGASQTFRLVVTPARTAAPNSVADCRLTANSVNDPGKTDTAKTLTTVK